MQGTAQLAWEALANVPFVVWSWLCFSAVSQQLWRYEQKFQFGFLRKSVTRLKICFWRRELSILKTINPWTLGFWIHREIPGENGPSSSDGHGRLGNKIDIPTAASEDELRNALGCAQGGSEWINETTMRTFDQWNVWRCLGSCMLWCMPKSEDFQAMLLNTEFLCAESVLGR